MKSRTYMVTPSHTKAYIGGSSVPTPYWWHSPVGRRSHLSREVTYSTNAHWPWQSRVLCVYSEQAVQSMVIISSFFYGPRVTDTLGNRPYVSLGTGGLFECIALPNVAQ